MIEEEIDSNVTAREIATGERGAVQVKVMRERTIYIYIYCEG